MVAIGPMITNVRDVVTTKLTFSNNFMSKTKGLIDLTTWFSNIAELFCQFSSKATLIDLSGKLKGAKEHPVFIAPYFLTTADNLAKKGLSFSEEKIKDVFEFTKASLLAVFAFAPSQYSSHPLLKRVFSVVDVSSDLLEVRIQHQKINELKGEKNSEEEEVKAEKEADLNIARCKWAAAVLGISKATLPVIAQSKLFKSSRDLSLPLSVMNVGIATLKIWASISEQQKLKIA